MMESIKQLVEKRLAGRFTPVPEGQEVPRRCVVCEDSGWERFLDDQKRLWARRCSCRASLPVNMHGCPEAFRAIRLAAVEKHAGNAAALKEVEHWIPRGRDLYLHGAAGVGKTMLACALVTEIARPARFELVDTLLRELVKADEDGELWNALRDAPVLVLDDVGVADTDWARRTLTTLYSERLDRKKRTIFTSNKSVRELVELWQDERLGSRIAGAADIVKLEGPDHRRRR